MVCLGSREILAEYVLRTASLIVLELDPAGVIREANAYARALMGDDCLGRPVTEVLVDFTGSFDLAGLLQNPERTHLFNVTTRSGLPESFYLRFVPTPERTLVIGELNSLEVEELRRDLVLANNELNNLARELQKKNAELARLNELKNHFLGMAAHDLRNPLGAIMLYSDYLLDHDHTRLNGDVVELLADIKSLSEFMLHMINDLLDISVIESGRMQLHLECVDFLPFVHQVIGLNAFLAEKKRISVTLQPTTEPIGSVVIDSQKIKQVLNNLIANAVKFSPPDTTVTISVQRGEQHLLLAISDQGPGIPAGEQQRLFKPFGTTSVRGTDGESSTGLGLAICHKIITAHKGRIWVESEAGKGASFSFSLPLTSP